MSALTAPPRIHDDAGHTLGELPHLTAQERWLLRLVAAGMDDASDLAEHTGLSGTEVRVLLAAAVVKLDAAC